MTCIRHMNLLYSNLPAFANCCYDGLLAVMYWLTARSNMLPWAMPLLVVSPPPSARSILLLAAGRVPTAGSRLLLAAGSGLRGVVVMLVPVGPSCAW